MVDTDTQQEVRDLIASLRKQAQNILDKADQLEELHFGSSKDTVELTEPAEEAPNPSILMGKQTELVLDHLPPHIHLSSRVRGYMRSNDISSQTINAVIDNATESWEVGDRENPRVVRVSEESEYGVITYDDDDGSHYVVAVGLVCNLYDERRQFGSGLRGTKSQGAGIKPVESLKDLGSRVKPHGLIIEEGKTHARVIHEDEPNGKFVAVPLTPSDTRSWKNCLAEIHRTFGIRA